MGAGGPTAKPIPAGRGARAGTTRQRHCGPGAAGCEARARRPGAGRGRAWRERGVAGGRQDGRHGKYGKYGGGRERGRAGQRAASGHRTAPHGHRAQRGRGQDTREPRP
nr:hypothetical protein StreXyl84_77670 [Streptomyces sp. Xyl84]